MEGIGVFVEKTIKPFDDCHFETSYISDSNIIAANGEFIYSNIEVQQYNEFKMVVTIPIKEVERCRCNYDLTKYGFINIRDILWVNTMKEGF